MILKFWNSKADEVLLENSTNSGSNNYKFNFEKKNYDSVEKRRACLYLWKG